MLVQKYPYLFLPLHMETWIQYLLTLCSAIWYRNFRGGANENQKHHSAQRCNWTGEPGLTHTTSQCTGMVRLLLGSELVPLQAGRKWLGGGSEHTGGCPRKLRFALCGQSLCSSCCRVLLLLDFAFKILSIMRSPWVQWEGKKRNLARKRWFFNKYMGEGFVNVPMEINYFHKIHKSIKSGCSLWLQILKRWSGTEVGF